MPRSCLSNLFAARYSRALDRREAAKEIISAEAKWWFSPMEGGELHQAGSKWADCPRATVNPDGSDYVGNPYCPGTVWIAGRPTFIDRLHDCNNVTSQNHVIRS